MRGFVSDPVCHRPKWSQILDYMMGFGRGGSAKVWQKLPAGEVFFAPSPSLKSNPPSLYAGSFSS